MHSPRGYRAFAARFGLRLGGSLRVLPSGWSAKRYGLPGRQLRAAGCRPSQGHRRSLWPFLTASMPCVARARVLPEPCAPAFLYSLLSSVLLRQTTSRRFRSTRHSQERQTPRQSHVHSSTGTATTSHQPQASARVLLEKMHLDAKKRVCNWKAETRALNTPGANIMMVLACEQIPSLFTGRGPRCRAVLQTKAHVATPALVSLNLRKRAKAPPPSTTNAASASRPQSK